MLNNSELIVYAPGPSMMNRTRLAKLARVCERKSIKVRFFGWERFTAERSSLSVTTQRYLEESSILVGGGYANSRLKIWYIVWFLSVFRSILFQKGGKVIWCLGWETAFPALIASLFKKNRIIFDDADRFSMLVTFPRPLQRLIEFLERFTSRWCCKHVVPSFLRYEWQTRNMFLLENTPLKSDIQCLATIDPIPRSRFTIFMNGWIAWDTGAPVVIKALDILAERGYDFELWVAGKIVSSAARELVERSYCTYKGQISQSEALALYKAVDCTLTAYDPNVRVNVYAASNKWADCILTECPFIVNSEIKTAADFIEAGAAFCFEYPNYNELAALIEGLLIDRSMLEASKIKIQKMRNRILPFDDGLSEILDFAYYSVE